MVYEKFLSPLIFKMWKRDPEIAHEKALKLLSFLSNADLTLEPWERLFSFNDPLLERSFCGLKFKNPVGLAAGFDKNAIAVRSLSVLGFGFLEIGTVTFEAQPGNPRPRIFRFPENQALINNMGFPNHGAEAMANRLKKYLYFKTPLGISLGIGKKNIRNLVVARDDLVASFRTLYDHGNYFAVCISSPNTPGLRELGRHEYLRFILLCLIRERERLERYENKPRKPILLKLSPDLDKEGLLDAVKSVKESEIEGVIATNTTAVEKGGVSGKPIFEKALNTVSDLREKLPDKLIIGVGGISTGKDAWMMLQAGANLVQIYTSFIYRGPFTAKKINRELCKILKNPV